MSDIVIVALIAGVVGPTILAYLNGRQRRAEKLEDYARQDIVAARQEAAVASAAADAKRSSAILIEGNRLVAATAIATGDKLDIIHTLVNSNMTAAMQSELDATVRELASLKEIIRLNRAAGNEPTEEADAAILSAEGKVTELTAKLNDRAKQQAVVVLQQQQQQQQQQQP